MRPYPGAPGDDGRNQAASALTPGPSPVGRGEKRSWRGGSAGRRLWHHDWKYERDLRRAVERAVTEHAGVQRGQTVVDIGCGMRPYEPFLHELGLQYVGCDLGGNCDVVIEPSRPIPLADGSARLVLSSQVLEHVWDLDWYLGECLRLLEADGRLILSTHGTWHYHPHPTDYRRWTRDGLSQELESRGFAVEHVTSVMGPLAWTTLFRLYGLRYALQKVPAVGWLLEIPIVCFMNVRMIFEDAITPAGIRDTNAATYVTCSRRADAVQPKASRDGASATARFQAEPGNEDTADWHEE